jgi:hypothetical protein
MTGWTDVEPDIASEKGGEQAVWRDLVARLESPPSYDLGRAPWPELENLPGSEPDEAGSEPDDEAEYDAQYDDGDEYFAPPQADPLPAGDPVIRGAWVALFGGPAYLLIAALFSWQLSGWSELVAILAFVIGFVVLVSRLGDGPSRRDGPDQGAVV